MRKFLKEFGVIFFFFFCFILAYLYFCDFFFSKEEYFDKKYKPAWILSQKEKDVDYAILGSSRAYGAFDMNLLDSLTGKKWINLGSNGSGMAENYMIINHFLKRNKVKTILIQVDGDAFAGDDSEQHRIHPYSFLPYWQDSIIKGVLTKEIKSLDSFLIRAIPQFRYLYYNKYFSPKEIFRRLKINQEPENTLDNLFGGEPIDIRTRAARSNIEKAIKSESAIKDINPYFLKIIDLAKSQNIDLLLFTAPVYYGTFEEIISIDEQFDYQIHLPEDRFQKDETLFSDTWHLNEKGRTLFTLSFFNRISPNYLLNLSQVP